MSSAVGRDRARLFLRCCRRLHPDILLRPGEAVDVGRGPQTGIRDRRLSRRQLRLVASAEEEEETSVSVRHLGGNQSTVAGRALGAGESASASPGDVICLLKGEYPHVVRLEEEEGGGRESEMPPKKVQKQEDRKENKPAVKQQHHGHHHWSAGLLAAMRDPAAVVEEDDEVVAIRDKYPKARHHYLVLPKRQDGVPGSVSGLRREHLPLVRRMHRLGRRLARERHPGSRFLLGYHSAPSMAHLHLHVVSTDFVSDSLRTRKHWNSFNTDFFLPADEVASALEEDGRVEGPDRARARELLATGLRCNRCRYRPRNMPDLKAHLLEHDRGGGGTNQF